MTDVLDLLVEADARLHGIEEAAAAGEINCGGPSRRRLRLAFECCHRSRPAGLTVVDELVAAGTPVDAVEAEFGRKPLRLAAENSRPASVRRLPTPALTRMCKPSWAGPSWIDAAPDTAISIAEDTTKSRRS